jgi:hypothetical protein
MCWNFGMNDNDVHEAEVRRAKRIAARKREITAALKANRPIIMSVKELLETDFDPTEPIEIRPVPR